MKNLLSQVTQLEEVLKVVYNRKEIPGNHISEEEKKLISDRRKRRDEL